MINIFYQRYILSYPKQLLAVSFLLIAFLGYFSLNLDIDASSDTLLVQDDKDLQFAKEVEKTYKASNSLVVVVSPREDLFSSSSLELIENLSNDLKTLDLVSSVTSIVNSPLFQSPPISIDDLLSSPVTIENKKANLILAKQEFLTSPLYKDNLVSSDLKTTAILLSLRDTLPKSSATKEDKSNARAMEHQNIVDIRETIKKYDNQADIFLGGVSMITSDIVDFVKSDLLVYGVILIVLLIVILLLIFKRVIWAVLPVLICILSVIATTGVIGLFGWKITVVSSNFIAIQLIITISIVLHLIIRYRELALKYTKTSQKRLVLNTILSKINPSFFAVTTTVAGFGSLMLADILPIVDLGLMMSIGIILSFIISFIVLPSILMLLPVLHFRKNNNTNPLILRLFISALFSRYRLILPIAVWLVLFSVFGISKLFVENSFINYFKQDTQIYKSLEIIDKKLGGTTPLDVILTFKTQDSDDEDDLFSDMLESVNNNIYWFSDVKMQEIIKVHDYLQSIDSIGSVQSFATALKLAKSFNNNKDLGSLELALLNKSLPQSYKDIIVAPYINIEKNQARFVTRIIDSDKNLRRNELINKIQNDLDSIISKDNSVQLSGLMILYNNMLQSLFDSQIKTLGLVVVLLFAMFLILFRSLKLSLIAIVANIIPIGFVFGVMGVFHIPLDIMTITIAAISIGIGVDGSIHYIFRFKKEFKQDTNYTLALTRTHSAIGLALIYTSLSIMVGFSILMLSNLVPTIYFGLLTVVAMGSILLSSLLLLPRLIFVIKPIN